jgi:hypothetical protein
MWVHVLDEDKIAPALKPSNKPRRIHLTYILSVYLGTCYSSLVYIPPAFLCNGLLVLAVPLKLAQAPPHEVSRSPSASCRSGKSELDLTKPNDSGIKGIELLKCKSYMTRRTFEAKKTVDVAWDTCRINPNTSSNDADAHFG